MGRRWPGAVDLYQGRACRRSASLEEERQALRVAAENIAGVRDVTDHTTLTPALPPI